MRLRRRLAPCDGWRRLLRLCRRRRPAHSTEGRQRRRNRCLQGERSRRRPDADHGRAQRCNELWGERRRGALLLLALRLLLRPLERVVRGGSNEAGEGLHGRLRELRAAEAYDTKWKKRVRLRKAFKARLQTHSTLSPLPSPSVAILAARSP